MECSNQRNHLWWAGANIVTGGDWYYNARPVHGNQYGTGIQGTTVKNLGPFPPKKVLLFNHFCDQAIFWNIDISDPKTLSGAVSSIMWSVDGSFCLPACIYRGQCPSYFTCRVDQIIGKFFPEYFIHVFISRFPELFVMCIFLHIVVMLLDRCTV